MQSRPDTALHLTVVCACVCVCVCVTACVSGLAPKFSFFLLLVSTRAWRVLCQFGSVLSQCLWHTIINCFKLFALAYFDRLPVDRVCVCWCACVFVGVPTSLCEALFVIDGLLVLQQIVYCLLKWNITEAAHSCPKMQFACVDCANEELHIKYI